MGEFNAKHNAAVWFDIPVADLDRAAGFYKAVLARDVIHEQYEDIRFCVIDHKDGNGGCLVVQPEQVAADKGILLYLNVDGRIRDAVKRVVDQGGEVVQDIHGIGPHGVRAIVKDSEGNRLALHSETDA